MNKIPTAKEFYDMHDSDDCVVMMREFAKLHVEEALKAAAENADLIDIDRFAFKIDKDTILNAYPLKNIK
jgi:hypothetical protein